VEVKKIYVNKPFLSNSDILGVAVGSFHEPEERLTVNSFSATEAGF